MIIGVGTNTCFITRYQSPDLPSPTIMTSPQKLNGGGWIMINAEPEPEHETNKDGKPPYTIPSMQEINEIPPNGYTVASTFSGCGGSCLGYRMAGFKVLWGNEFIPAAQASYRANMSTGSILDGRDIKVVRPEEILEVTGLKKGELDLFDGSPPCQAFSTSGKREKDWGKNKTYENGASQCNETLFFEYIRILRGLMPRTFVAENVSGLIKGAAKGYFLEILHGLKACGYRVGVRVLDAQWLGVPQTRQRVIFVGVREDLTAEPVHPKPLPYRYSVRDALPWIERAVHDTSGRPGFSCGEITNVPAPAVLASCTSLFVDQETQAQSGAFSNTRRRFTITEVKRICSFPDDFILLGSFSRQWERLGNSVPPLMMRAVAEVIRDNILNKSNILVYNKSEVRHV